MAKKTRSIKGGSVIGIPSPVTFQSLALSACLTCNPKGGSSCASSNIEEQSINAMEMHNVFTRFTFYLLILEAT
jgi:hypothetical protein